MRIEFLIFGLIALILGIVISGIVGNILLILGILVLLYAIFSRGKSRKGIKEMPHDNSTYNRPVKKSMPQPPERKIKSRDINSKDISSKDIRSKDRSVDQQPKRRLKVIELEDSNKCPECGSTNNPENARFCADCGKKLRE